MRIELRHSRKDASGAKKIRVQINSKRPLHVQVQKLMCLCQGHVLWRRPFCGRLGVPIVCVGITLWCSAAVMQHMGPCATAEEPCKELSVQD